MDEIKLGRVGHYAQRGTAEGSFSCQAASVAHVNEDDATVNLTVSEHDGSTFGRTNVPVSTVPAVFSSSFHLNRDCPAER